MYSETQTGEHNETKLLHPLLGLPVMLLLGLCALITLPFLLIARTYWRIRERRFARKIAAGGRAMEPSTFAVALEEKRGTLIEEWAPYNVGHGPVRGWWTPDDVSSVSPYPVPDDGAKAVVDADFGPFNTWCQEVYTGAHGKALLVWDRSMDRPLQEDGSDLTIPLVITKVQRY